MLVLKEVTHSDQGLYSIKLSTGFTYETVRLTVSECIKSYRRVYGESFEHNIPTDGSIMEFSPLGSPPDSKPVVLWNRTDPETSDQGRGRLLHGGKVWMAERVTQADQGNYTIRGGNGTVVSRSTLTVHGHALNVTRFTKESLNLPLFLPVPHAHLIFTPTHYPDESSLGPFDPRPPRGPVQLMRNGLILDYDLRFRSLIFVGRNGSVNQVVIGRLSTRHDGIYDVRDREGNLVSSTSLHVIDKTAKWRAVLKSITVPSGMFVTLAGFILFMKRYPTCSLSQILTGLRANHSPAANPPRINIQDYSQPSPQPTPQPFGYYGPPHITAPRKWSPSPSPIHTGCTPLVDNRPQLVSVSNTAGSGEADSLIIERATSVESTTENIAVGGGGRKISFSVAGASDCLHADQDCAQFQIKKEGIKERWSQGNDYFSTLPLDTDTSEDCSVYTSEKLNYL
ncbi:uncharacterized protein FYW47_014160 [Aplochiton taeniatus]